MIVIAVVWGILVRWAVSHIPGFFNWMWDVTGDWNYHLIAKWVGGNHEPIFWVTFFVTLILIMIPLRHTWLMDT